MTGHTMFEVCGRCGRATIDVVEDVCVTCGRRAELGHPLWLGLVCAVVGGAVALAMGWL